MNNELQVFLISSVELEVDINPTAVMEVFLISDMELEAILN